MVCNVSFMYVLNILDMEPVMKTPLTKSRGNTVTYGKS